MTAPILAFFFFTLTFSALLSRLSVAFLTQGLLQPNWITHNVFQVRIRPCLAFVRHDRKVLTPVH